MVGTYSVEEPEVPRVGQVVDGKRIGLGRESENGLHGDIHDHHTLGAEVERQNLESVGDEKTRETDGVEDTENPDKDNLADTIAFRAIMSLIFAGQGSPDGEGNNHANDSGQEEWATSNFVDEERSGNGHDQAEGSVAEGETKLLSLGCDSAGLVDQVGVVGNDGVTRILRDDTNGDDNSKPPAVTPGSEEIHVAAVVTSLLLEAKGFADLAEFELYRKVLVVAIGVPLGQGLECFLVAVFGDQPSGRFRNS
jgi:hypothetical protein